MAVMIEYERGHPTLLKAHHQLEGRIRAHDGPLVCNGFTLVFVYCDQLETTNNGGYPAEVPKTETHPLPNVWKDGRKPTRVYAV